jgi:hypothetical protein
VRKTGTRAPPVLWTKCCVVSKSSGLKGASGRRRSSVRPLATSCRWIDGGRVKLEKENQVVDSPGCPQKPVAEPASGSSTS